MAHESLLQGLNLSKRYKQSLDIGQTISVRGVSITGVSAHHPQSFYPMGFFLQCNGSSIYHAGDTAIFGDMLLYGTLYPIDMALIPIGGAFTMDAMQAAKSLRLLTPKKTIPMHYGTFPMMAPNADEFVKLAKKYAYGVDVSVLQPGGTYILQP